MLRERKLVQEGCTWATAAVRGGQRIEEIDLARKILKW